MYVPNELLDKVATYREARLESLEPMLRSLQGKSPRRSGIGPAAWRARLLSPVNDRQQKAISPAARPRSKLTHRVGPARLATPQSGWTNGVFAALQHPGVVVRRWLWALLLGAVAIVYFIINSKLPGLIVPELSVYLVQPLTWIALGGVAFYGWRYTLRSRPTATVGLAGLAGLTGLAQVALLAIAGLVFGFGYSPYGHKLPVLLGNLLFVGSTLVAVEFARAYLVTVLGRGSPVLAVGSVSLLLALVGVPLGQLTAAVGPGEYFRFVGGTLLPGVAESLLASLLALSGGPLVSLAYRVMLHGFEWLSPILPNLNWPIVALIGTVGPTLGLFAIRDQLSLPFWPKAHAESRSEGVSDSWLLVALFAVIVIWLNTGLLGVQPTLVSGPSMVPTLHAGDIVVTKQVPIADIKVGDIIRFQLGDSHIIHRVFQIDAAGGRSQIITKGDANNTLDPSIGEAQLAGKVILTIPKLGWLGIGLRQLLEFLR